jgi:branched-chain amino acid transport system ATP-binding protein
MGRANSGSRPGSNSRNAASDSGKTETHEARRAPSRARRSAFAFEKSRIADNLTKSFGGLRAVDDVSFSLAANEILGIAGPNANGKSTLFNILINIPFPADSGRIVLDGREIQDVARGELSRSGIARTFQRESIFVSLRAIDNVLVAIEHNGKRRGRKRDEAAAIGALDTVGFPQTMHNSPTATLPIFFRKILMIASALAVSPRVLLLDKPASSLTPDEIEHMKKLILKLRKSGVAILLIEHVLPLLMSVCDRLIVLDQGRIISQGLPTEVVADPKVVEAHLGQPR